MLCTEHSGQYDGRHWRHYKEACVPCRVTWYVCIVGLCSTGKHFIFNFANFNCTRKFMLADLVTDDLVMFIYIDVFFSSVVIWHHHMGDHHHGGFPLC